MAVIANISACTWFIYLLIRLKKTRLVTFLMLLCVLVIGFSLVRIFMSVEAIRSSGILLERVVSLTLLIGIMLPILMFLSNIVLYLTYKDKFKNG